MEHWQFLIQKQGDRAWHTLESPNLEILEGRYRVLARSNRPNIDVEVRVTHSSIQEVPLLLQVQKRSRRTNAEGLMAVIPFTHLKPGIWELRCSGELMSNIVSTSWQYSVRLQVLPHPAQEDMRRLSAEEIRHTAGFYERLVSPDSDTFSHRNLVATATAQRGSTIHNTIITAPVITRQSNAAATEMPIKKDDDAFIDAPITPVWVKGETAAQILQNLLGLALPASEFLLEDERVENSPAVQPPPPLLLTLEKEIYVASWGQTLSLNGRVELKEATLGETSDLESVCAAEVRIELRSPQGSEILTQVRQPLPEKFLPFTISSQIEIPEKCESKLILADISLYGALAGIGEVIMLASQSFTIIADVTELLAITTAAKLSTPEELDYQLAPSAAFKQPKPSPLDLGLFNLVKTPKTAKSLVLHPSPKKSLPPRIDPRSLREAALRASMLNKSAASGVPKLPTLPHGQTKIIAAAVVCETSSKLQPLENKYTIIAEPQEAISKEQARLSFSTGTTFPYLTRLKPLPDDGEEIKSNALDTQDYQTPEESQQIGGSTAEYENVAELVERHEDAPELVAGDAQSPDNSFAEVVVQRSSKLITADNAYSSPLIQKWMQSQGYSLPEPLNVQYEDYHTYIPAQQTISDHQTPFSLSAQTPTADVNLPLNQEFDTGTQAHGKAGNVSQVSTSPHQVPQLAPPRYFKTPSAWLAQEIVVDDLPNEPEADAARNRPFEQKEQPIPDLSISLAIATAITDPLPIPQLHVPDGELIAGKSVRVRVQLQSDRPQLAVKLWVEDCQTRWLLNGPHLLKNLLFNSRGDLEVTTQLNIPFGCWKIRVEAIAIDIATQQESHKVTIVRTVIPPDLPTLQLDELLGM